MTLYRRFNLTQKLNFVLQPSAQGELVNQTGSSGTVHTTSLNDQSPQP